MRGDGIEQATGIIMLGATAAASLTLGRELACMLNFIHLDGRITGFIKLTYRHRHSTTGRTKWDAAFRYEETRLIRCIR